VIGHPTFFLSSKSKSRIENRNRTRNRNRNRQLPRERYPEQTGAIRGSIANQGLLVSDFNFDFDFGTGGHGALLRSAVQRGLRTR